MNAQISETTDLLARITRNISRIEELATGTNALQGHTELASLLAGFAQTAPLPMWIKNRDGQMIWMNDAYLSWYGVNLDRYIGHRDSAEWSCDTAASFDENDQRVLDTGRPLVAVEQLWNKKYNETESLQVIKFPLIVENEGHVCVAGLGLGFIRGI